MKSDGTTEPVPRLGASDHSSFLHYFLSSSRNALLLLELYPQLLTTSVSLVSSSPSRDLSMMQEGCMGVVPGVSGIGKSTESYFGSHHPFPFVRQLPENLSPTPIYVLSVSHVSYLAGSLFSLGVAD